MTYVSLPFGPSHLLSMSLSLFLPLSRARMHSPIRRLPSASIIFHTSGNIHYDEPASPTSTSLLHVVEVEVGGGSRERACRCSADTSGVMACGLFENLPSRTILPARYDVIYHFPVRSSTRARGSPSRLIREEGKGSGRVCALGLFIGRCGKLRSRRVSIKIWSH